jgi:uncharacterized protein with von Willebrand factor type A (vWA) domain
MEAEKKEQESKTNIEKQMELLQERLAGQQSAAA